MGLRSGKPGYRLEAAALTAVITAVLLFATWRFASPPVDPDAQQMQTDIEFLTRELDTLTARHARMEARNAVLERETDVLRQANRLLREQESERQADLNRMQSELDFFRRLAGTGGAQEGLDVYQVELLPTDSARVFQYVITLTQNIRRAAVISGRLGIGVEGVRDDRPVTIDWSGLAAAGEPEPAFRFKYFQQLEGYLGLPEGLSPTRLVLTLDADDRRGAVQRAYDWDALLNPEGAAEAD